MRRSRWAELLFIAVALILAALVVLRVVDHTSANISKWAAQQKERDR